MTDDAESHFGYAPVLIVAQFENVIARLGRRQVVAKTVGRDADLLRLRDAFLENGLVSVFAVLLFGQNGNVFLRDDVERHVFDRDAIQLRIDRDQIERARFVHVDVMQVAVGFGTDDVRQGGDQRAHVAGDAATTFRFKTFGDKTHRVGRVGETLQLQIELGAPGVVGFLFTEIDRFVMSIFLCVDQRIVKDVTAKLRKTECSRRKFDPSGDAAIGRGRAIKVSQRDGGADIFGIDPAARRAFRKPRLNFHPIGLEFLHVCRGRSKQSAALAVDHEVSVEGVEAGGRFVSRLVGELREPALRQRQFSCLHTQAARIHDLSFNRQSFEVALPVPLFHDQADVNFVARPVNAALGKTRTRRGFPAAHFHAPSMSKREKFRARSSRAYGMKETSSPLRATNATGDFSRSDLSTDENAQ